MKPASWLMCYVALIAVAGCSRQPSLAPAATASDRLPKLRDVSAQAGLRWIHNAGRSGKKYLPETVGGGGGFLDYNNDGLLDILLVNGGALPGYRGSKPLHALYKNNGVGTFTNVSQEAGLTTGAKEYGMGAAVADFDNDGWADIFLTGVGGTRLLHNVKGRFVEVTRASGTDVNGFTTAATWLDYDRDGFLDLFVARYVAWTPEADLPCGPANARKYCAPYQYLGAPPTLFHNNRNGTFTDVSQRAGVLGHSSKTLSLAPYDFNHDGWIDLFLANDTEPDVLLINQKNGTFHDEGLVSGVALGTNGSATGSMGTDVATPFGDSRIGLAVGVFAGQRLSLFAEIPGALLFENLNERARVAQPTAPMTTFGLAFSDIDSDGFTDLLVMNGHIDDDPSMNAGGSHVPYKQPTQLFLNEGAGTFRDVTLAAGLSTPLIGRGLAVGDIDNDGLPDFLAFENGGPAHLWHNETAGDRAWIGIRLVGTKSPRDGTGAIVTIEEATRQQSRCVTTTRSYLSVCDPRLLFGLQGPVRRVVVRWPSGTQSELRQPEKNLYMTITEPPF